jgi:hypothetical protein
VAISSWAAQRIRRRRYSRGTSPPPSRSA